MSLPRAKSEPLHDVRSDYEIAKQGGRFRRPRTGVTGVGTSGDFHFRSESKYLYHIEYARDLDRNDIVAGMVLDRLLDNVLQETGIQPDPDTGDENLDQLLKDDWQEWAEDENQCDLAGEMTFHEMERSLLRGMLVDGDIMAIPNVNGTLEVMEAHRCRTPRNSKKNLVYGVELDQDRRHLTYYFTRDEIEPHRALRKVGDTTQVDTLDEDGNRQVFHISNPHRVSLTRGVSVFHRTADAIGMHDDIEFANLVRQQIASCFAIIREKTKAPPKPGGSNGYGPTQQDRLGSSFTRTLENIGPGMQISTEEGEKITGFSPNVPNPQFFEHAYLLLKLISANLGLPLHAVLLDATQTNFSGWRGAVDQARAGWRRLQSHLIRRFHKHVWRWRVNRLLATSRLARTLASQNDVNPYKVKWKRPSWEYIEPLKDTTADISKMRGLISSPRRIHSRRGDDYDEVIQEIVKDHSKAIRFARDAAREINQGAQDESERITWDVVLFLTQHNGLEIQLGNPPDDQPSQQQSPQRQGSEGGSDAS